MVVKTNLTHTSQDNLKKINPTGILVLENGSFFKGLGFGFESITTGEVCFNTSITGYQEIISDPSYAGQIINFTFPHIGNVGTNNDDHESDKIWARGVIFNSEISNPSNYRALNHLDIWLKKNKIVGITGLDTRSLTNFIRDKGAPKGIIQFSKKGEHNIKELLNKSKLLIHTSKLETFGLVAVEANAMGVPVLTTNSGSLLEIVEHNKNGFYSENWYRFKRSIFRSSFIFIRIQIIN